MKSLKNVNTSKIVLTLLMLIGTSLFFEIEGAANLSRFDPTNCDKFKPSPAVVRGTSDIGQYNMSYMIEEGEYEAKWNISNYIDDGEYMTEISFNFKGQGFSPSSAGYNGTKAALAILMQNGQEFTFDFIIINETKLFADPCDYTLVWTTETPIEYQVLQIQLCIFFWKVDQAYLSFSGNIDLMYIDDGWNAIDSTNSWNGLIHANLGGFLFDTHFSLNFSEAGYTVSSGLNFSGVSVSDTNVLQVNVEPFLYSYNETIVAQPNGWVNPFDFNWNLINYTTLPRQRLFINQTADPIAKSMIHDQKLSKAILTIQMDPIVYGPFYKTFWQNMVFSPTINFSLSDPITPSFWARYHRLIILGVCVIGLVGIAAGYAIWRRKHAL